MEKKWLATLIISIIVVVSVAGFFTYQWYSDLNTHDNDDSDDDPSGGSNLMIINHNHAHKGDLEDIPLSWINITKENLHIMYWHTSHGSQLTTGMAPLDTFMEGNDYYLYSSSEQPGYLHLEEDSADLTNYPNDWFQITRDFLNNPANEEINVVMWSWCDPVTDFNAIDFYLNNMSELEKDYPDVKFVYMTHHVDGNGEDGPGNQANERIRDFCGQNNKILYDFADIESYNPDDDYFLDKNVNDNCDYDGGNWALEWQAAHTEGDDWYSCSASHTQPLNGNLKAYGAWYLFARIAGWSGN